MREIAKAPDGDMPSGGRIHSALDELARAHLDVEGDLVVDLLIERHTPQP